VFISRFGGGDGKVAGLPALPVEFWRRSLAYRVRRQPPRMGEHNAEVLGEAGFTAAEIANLAESGVIAARNEKKN
jgi:crotonobetainyl-CoA:carnitine CoA-transferase CaiB-like acyl-CoA transferase